MIFMRYRKDFFFTGITPVLETAIPILLDRLKAEHSSESLVVAFPDDGAQKRFHNFFTAYPNLVCSKVREGDKRIVTIKDGDCNGKNVIIIDDLVRTGGTLLECRSALLKAGARKTMCFCTHAVFPEQSYKRFLQDDQNSNTNTFDIFYVTNSCPEIAAILERKKPFQILSLIPKLLEFIETNREFI